MSGRSKKVTNVEPLGKRGVLIRDYEEDSRGRRKRAKPNGSGEWKVETLVEADNRLSRSKALEAEALEAELTEPVIAEPDYTGLEDDLDALMASNGDELGSEDKKTPNQLLKDWLTHISDDYLGALFEAHAAPLSDQCESCHNPSDDLYSCINCIGHQSLCSGCLTSAHRSQPTHHVCHWNGHFWEPTTLHKLGFVLDLGHRGSPCSETLESKTILVGDITGFHYIPVRFCTHDNAPPPFIQLLCAGIFPCTDKSPQSAFTVSCLEHFDLFHTIGAVSSQKYYDVLVKLTSAGFPHTVKDRYRELMMAHRRYCHLKNLKRSGSAYESHPLELDFRDHAVPCVGCPLPGFNYDPKTIPAKLLPFIRMWVSYDGNFANSRKAKKVDKDDLCLSDGLQYYVKNDPYEAWALAGGKERDKGSKPECNNHKAGKSDTFGTWGGLDITGIGLFSCTRHTSVLPQGLVDFRKGEKFRYGDYAFGSMVNYKLHRGPQAFGMTYDIWCHWIVNLKKQALEFPQHVKLPENMDLIGGIPKWHLVGHKRVCHVRYSLNFMPHCGRMDGEGPERFWAYLNQTCGSTSEKRPGYRRDTINNLIDSWNFSKMIGIHKHLASSFVLAKKMFLQQRNVFVELNSSLPEEVTAKWSEEPTDAVLVDNKWQSPLYEDDVPVASFAETLRDAKSGESSNAHIPSWKIGSAQWIASGIELEHAMQKIRKLGTELGQSPTDHQYTLLSSKRVALSSKVTDHQQQGSIYMGDIGTPDHPDRKVPMNSEPEHAELCLPSRYSRSTVMAAGSLDMVELEIRLRRATCDDALQILCNLLGVKALTLKFVKGNLSGEKAVTRVETRLKEHNKKIAAVQWRYNNSRSALMRLGLSDEDMKLYQAITPEDIKYLKFYLQEESGSLGEGSRSVSWLWRTSRQSDEDRWQVEALKTEWFRSRERYRRWEEESMLLKREILMARNSFRSLEEIWDFKAQSARNRPGMSSYAAKKAQFYRKLGDQLRMTCSEVFIDDIVDIEWKDGWEDFVANSVPRTLNN